MPVYDSGGDLGGGIYNLQFIYDTGSFGFSNEALTQLANSPETTFNLFNYYSFVTLTTLGYGDIVPLKPTTQAWVVMEAIVGPVLSRYHYCPPRQQLW